jgi:hypothetical protein
MPIPQTIFDQIRIEGQDIRPEILDGLQKGFISPSRPGEISPPAIQDGGSFPA